MENYVSRHHQDVLRKAEAGDAEAQAILGSFFFNGVPEAGLEPDFEQAARRTPWGKSLPNVPDSSVP